MSKPYLTGRWAIFQTRASAEVLGYIINGVGQSTTPGVPPFQISDGALFAPDGKRLGHLAPLGDSWAVNLGDHEVGHVLRVSPKNHLGIDAELFQFMLEQSFVRRGHRVPVDEIKRHLEEKLSREVTVDEISRTVVSTQYTQRNAQGRRTNIRPYDEVQMDGKLHQLRMLDHVAQNTSQWGW